RRAGRQPARPPPGPRSGAFPALEVVRNRGSSGACAPGVSFLLQSPPGRGRSARRGQGRGPERASGKPLPPPPPPDGEREKGKFCSPSPLRGGGAGRGC